MGETAFHYPAAPQQEPAVLPRRATDDLDRHVQFLWPVRTCVAATVRWLRILACSLAGKVPTHQAAATGATVSQFAISRSGVPTFEGLVYVYPYGRQRHVCGSGQAAANRQSAPTYVPFHLDLELVPGSIGGSAVLGTDQYILAAVTRGPPVPASGSALDNCTLAVPAGLQPSDGPFASGLQSAIDGHRLCLAAYPPLSMRTPLGGSNAPAAIDQFAFTRPGSVPAYEGLVYVYRHGAQLHDCGSGQAVANGNRTPVSCSSTSTASSLLRLR